MRKITVILMSCIVLCLSGSAAEIHVPADYSTIQMAVNAAGNGDTILLADGTWSGPGFTDINMQGKQLAVLSASDDPDLCLIDCGGSSRGFLLDNGEPQGTVIRSITVQNGSSNEGGAIYLGSNSHLALENCKFLSNNAIHGGAVYAGNQAVFSDTGSVFYQNSAQYGGGVYLSTTGDCSLSQTTLSYCTAYYDGGAINFSSSDLIVGGILINGVTMEYNSSGRDGSACYYDSWIDHASFQMNGCSVENNSGAYAIHLEISAKWYNTDYQIINTNISLNTGGGLFASGLNKLSIYGTAENPPSISNNTKPVGDESGAGIYVYNCQGGLSMANLNVLRNHLASGNGGGLFIENTPTTLNGILFKENECGQWMGGAVCALNSTIDMTNCAFTLNVAASDYAGAIFTDDNITAMNCTILGNHALWGRNVFLDGGFGDFTNCIFWGNTSDSGGTLGLYGNAVAAYCDFENGEYPAVCDHCISEDPECGAYIPLLSPGSPCRDSGTGSGAPSTDFMGNPRPSGFKVDMGWHEVQVSTICGVIFQDVDTTGESNDFDRDCGLSSEVDVYAQLDTSDLSIGDPIEVYLTEETGADFTVHLLNDPDPSMGCLDSGTVYARTIYTGGLLYIVVDGGEGQFSLDIRCKFPADIINLDRKYTTLQAAIDDAQNGDTIEVADGTYTGVCNRNVNFNGTGVCVSSMSGDPDACVFDFQNADRGFVIDTSETGVTLNGLSLLNGFGPVTGAGLQCSGTSLSVTNCIIRDNSSIGWGGGEGGGVYLSSSDADFINCVFTGNQASSGVLDGYGAGLYCSNSSSSLINCTIMDNTAQPSGGGLFIDNGSSYQIRNCIFWGNSGTGGENEIASNIPATVEFCDIQGMCPPNITCLDSISEDPGIVLPDYHLPSDSPCIDVGTDIGVPVTDIDGQARPNPFWGSFVTDIGADEYFAPCLNHGDVNADGSLTASDAQDTFFIVLGMMTPTYDQWCAADCNGDGSVTAADAQSIFLAVLGMEPGCNDSIPGFGF